MVALMAILWAAEAAAAPLTQLPPDIAWASATAEDDRFWIRAEDIRSQYYPAVITVALHGEHGHNSRVSYKKSLQQIRFFCDGTLQLVALSTTDAKGRTSEWQGAGSVDRISAGTVYQKLERQVCGR
jgi:hypothetical protein